MKDETREVVRQWRAKAHSDWMAVEILLGSEQCPRDTLTIHGVETRYPGDWYEIERTEMEEVVHIAKQLGELLHLRLDE